MNGTAKVMILAGIVLVVTGFIVALAGKIQGAGKFPGDIYIRKGDFSFYFPLATCLLISAVLTVLINLFMKR